jgi:hypothetical protein
VAKENMPEVEHSIQPINNRDGAYPALSHSRRCPK